MGVRPIFACATLSSLLAGWESFREEYEKAEEQAKEKADRDRKRSSSSRNSHRNVYEMKGNFSHTNPVVQHASVDNSILEETIENNNPAPVKTSDLVLFPVPD